MFQIKVKNRATVYDYKDFFLQKKNMFYAFNDRYYSS